MPKPAPGPEDVPTLQHAVTAGLATGSGDIRPMRTVIKKLRRKRGADAANPTYIFTEPRVGYRMPKGERPWPDAS